MLQIMIQFLMQRQWHVTMHQNKHGGIKGSSG